MYIVLLFKAKGSNIEYASRKHLKIVTARGKLLAQQLALSPVTRIQVMLFSWIIYAYTIRYSLPQCFFSKNALDTAQSKSIPLILAKCGYMQYLFWPKNSWWQRLCALVDQSEPNLYTITCPPSRCNRYDPLVQCQHLSTINLRLFPHGNNRYSMPWSSLCRPTNSPRS
jgi:hypothetical protein